VALTVLPASSQAGHEKHWGYSDSDETVGPPAWGSLPNDSVCGIGKEQSPIDLPSSAKLNSSLAAPVFHNQPSAVTILNNGHTVQVNLQPGNTITLNGQTYKLAQFHFHAPSEHTVDGKHFPMEIHMVYLNEKDKPALVVGLLVQPGGENQALDAVLSHMPQKEGENIATPGLTVNVGDFLPASRTYWHYSGSLTTPPCSEGLKWFVMQTPISLSTEQVAAFSSIPHMDHTNRPVQSLDARQVQLVSGK